MKTIEYYGSHVLVESWVSYVAMDKDRQVYGYESEPFIDEDKECWLPQHKAHNYFIYEVYVPPSKDKVSPIDWEKSLIEV